MMTRLRWVWKKRWLMAVFLVASVWTVNRGQALPEDFPPCALEGPGAASVPTPAEPPMVDAPRSPQSPSSPAQPFMPPFPTPLPPQQGGIPFGPAAPFAPVENREPPPPTVRLHVHAPARVEPDKEIEYRLTLENVSRADAHHVLVRDRLPRGMEEQVRAEPKPSEQTKSKDGSTDLLWKLGTLKAGEQKVIVLAIKPKGSDEVHNRAYVQFEHGQTVATKIDKPGLRLKATAPAQASRYDSITFQLAITNTGAAPLREVVLTDELPDDLTFAEGKPQPNSEKPFTWKIGDIAPNETRRVEYQAIAQKMGTFRNKAVVTAAGGLRGTDSAAVVVGERKVQISMSNPQRRSAQRSIPYHITVRNLGSVPLTNVQVSNEIPHSPRGPALELLRASPGGRLERGLVRWSLGTVAAGERRSLWVVLRAAAPGWYWNAASIRADNKVSETADSGWTRIDAATDAVLEIDKSGDALDVGQEAIYTIHFVNLSNKNIPNSRLTVTVPEELSLLDERGPTTSKREGETVRFDVLKMLTKGDDKQYIIRVKAKKAGVAHLRAAWSEGIEAPRAQQTWEDNMLIVDAAGSAPDRSEKIVERAKKK
jgi:uncharacterized repeat protein (TIGR01451 family)